MLGYDVTVRPATTPASTRVHGPWQMAATGLPELTKSRTNATAESSSRSLSGLTVPPGNTSASKSSTDASDTASIDSDSSGRLQVVVTRLNVTGFQRQQLNVRAVLGQLRARRLEFDLLDTVGSQNGYFLALQ